MKMKTKTLKNPAWGLMNWFYCDFATSHTSQVVLCLVCQKYLRHRQMNSKDCIVKKDFHGLESLVQV